MFIALFFSLFALIILIRLRVELGPALLASTLLLGILNGIGPRGVWQVLFHSFWQETTFTLIATLFAIIALENVLRRQGYLDRLLAALRVLTRDPRTIMALCPAFLGLLPSVGGAIFSAPMVEEVASDSSLSPEEKSFINYWFRHIVGLLPLVLAPIIGLSQGFVGTCFPLLSKLIGLGQKARIGLASLAYCAGFTGLMLTPLHLCFALTVQFFGADLGRVWRRLLLPMAIVFSAAVIYSLILP